jgi:hypothetical protein
MRGGILGSVDVNDDRGGVVRTATIDRELDDLAHERFGFNRERHEVIEFAVVDHAGDSVGAKKITISRYELGSGDVYLELIGLTDAPCDRARIAKVMMTRFAACMHSVNFIFNGMIFGEALEFSIAPEVSARVTGVRYEEMMLLHAAKRQR